MDPGTTDNEFLGIDIGNNGSYRRLTSWSGQHADGQWHLETFTLSGDQISNAFSLRFFGITTNDFTTVAIDNVMIAAAPGSVVVEPVEPGEPEEDTEETEQPDLTVTYAVTPPRSVPSGSTIALYTRVTNTGTETDDAAIHVYRHTSETTTPRTGGTRESNTATTGTLAPNASVTVTSTHSAPTVLRTTRYYYYVCANTFCVTDPATVLVRVKPEDPGPPYERCFVVPERSTPMGGDTMFSLFIGDPDGEIPRGCGTITLGGVETTTGVRGFIASGHVVVRSTYDDEISRSIEDYSRTDTLIGHGRSAGFVKELQHFLGKVFQMPSFYTEGDKRILSTDAALVAYPGQATPGCSLTWSGDGEDFCLDQGSGDYIERLVPLTVRGANGETYKVVGSQEPTEGLPIRVSGAVTGTPISSVAKGDELLVGGIRRNTDGHYYEYLNHSRGGKSTRGNSGAPIYTVPDADGNVRIVGILVGSTTSDRLVFNSWKTVKDEFNLQPISAPDGPTEEDEADLAGLFSAFD